MLRFFDDGRRAVLITYGQAVAANVSHVLRAIYYRPTKGPIGANNKAIRSPPMLYGRLFAILTCLVLVVLKFGNARQATVNSVFKIPSANLTVMKRKVQIDSRVVASGHLLPKFVEAEEGKHSVLVSFYCVEVDEVTGETKPALPHQTLVAFTNQKTK